MRIVAKVDELMAVCDELGAALDSAQDDRWRLLEATLNDAPSQVRETGPSSPLAVGMG